MYVFWDALIEPLLESTRPKTLVEIGSDEGDNTRKLLEFCERHDAKLHVIDPVPKYDVTDWEDRYGERLVFHRSLSLEALPEIDGFDAVLIDGDHNWYTVYNELKVIENRCKALRQPFPLVMMHDVSWPYARRDGYYDPSNIPEEHRQIYEYKGVGPGSSDLLESGGYNSNIANATSEGGPRNGVVTAVEDFVVESDEELEFVSLPGLHGFGMLIPSGLKARNVAFAELVSDLRLSPSAERYVRSLEDARLETEGRRERIERRRQRAEAALRAAEDSHREQVKRIEELKNQLDEIRGSRTWRLMSRLGGLRARVRKR